MLQILKKHPAAEFFMRPPDPSKPYYTELMQDFLDFPTIESNLKEGNYYSSFQFVQDIRKLFQKAFKIAGTADQGIYQ